MLPVYAGRDIHVRADFRAFNKNQRQGISPVYFDQNTRSLSEEKKKFLACFFNSKRATFDINCRS